MCGIVAYLGNGNTKEILLKGLKRLEYRGYDSAGIALILSRRSEEISLLKKKGKVHELEALIQQQQDLSATIGIGHTRWATHGQPSDENAHPHFSVDESIAMVHNGIIENYLVLKKDLMNKGYSFRSDTDTEVFVNFIHYIQHSEDTTLENAVRIALSKVVGAYAIALFSREEPNKLIAAKKGSPLVVGLGKEEYFVASDATPIIEHTNEVIYLGDEEIVTIEKDNYKITDIKDIPKLHSIQVLDMELEMLEKGGYEHFMLKEIFEQPRSISDCMRGRLNSKANYLVLGGILNYQKTLLNAKKIIFVACGTSWHSALLGEYIFEDLCRIPVEVEYASEFRYRNPIIEPGAIVIAISQSGETADTLAAVELAKNKGAIVFGIVNTVGSSISRLTHEGAYLHAGPEIGVASTKAFTAQIIVLLMMACKVAYLKGKIPEKKFKEILIELESIPDKIQQCLDKAERIKEIASLYRGVRNFLYLGRGFNFPVALEGALKLKEISYIHAEGYPAAEMKHGPIALIDEEMPVVVIAPQDSSYKKVISNIQEIKARKGTVIAIVTEGDEEVKNMADFTIEVPPSFEIFKPLLTVIPLQLLSYYIAVMRGINVDQPRNLAKSVTVE